MNGSARSLTLLGAALVVVGGIIAMTANNNAERERQVELLRSTLSGASPYDPTVGSGTEVWMWVGIVTAVLGALVLIGVLFLRAARRESAAPTKATE